MSSVLDLLELLDWFVAALAGWRYLFSPKYRRQVHADWKDERWCYIAWDVACGTGGIALSGAILFGAFWLLSRILSKALRFWP